MRKDLCIILSVFVSECEVQGLFKETIVTEKY